MNPARKDTFGLMEMKKLQKSAHAPTTDAEEQNPQIATATTSSPQRQKEKVIDLGEVGEEEEESGEGESLIHVENQVRGMTQPQIVDVDGSELDLSHRSAGSSDR